MPLRRRSCLQSSLALMLMPVAAAAQPRWERQEEYRIERAAYGTPERYVDVTEQLREIGRRDQRVQVTNRLFGHDPAPGEPKVLRLYAVGRGGRRRTFEFPEDSWIDGSLFSGWGQGGWGQGGGQSGDWGGAPGYEDGGRGDFQITRARWGSGSRQADVTQRLRQLAGTNRSFRVDNDSMGIDPARGQVKTLRIEARTRDGRSRSFDYPEGAWVDGAQFSNWGGSGPVQRPEESDGLEILSAEYGAGYQRVDVSERLQRQVRNGRLRLRVNNDSMGHDPAPGVPKELRLQVRVSGQRHVRNLTLREGERLDLP